MKVRFLCTKHECDLSYDSKEFLVEELLSDVDKSIPMWPGPGQLDLVTRELSKNKYTGYFLFDLSECYCSEDDGNRPTREIDSGGEAVYSDSECQNTWKVVIYSD